MKIDSVKIFSLHAELHNLSNPFALSLFNYEKSFENVDGVTKTSFIKPNLHYQTFHPT